MLRDTADDFPMLPTGQTEPRCPVMDTSQLFLYCQSIALDADAGRYPA